MTTEPAVLAIRHDHLDRILDQYGGTLDEDTIHRYLLVERSTIDGSLHCSTHRWPSAAFTYQSNQEYAEEWIPVRLVDLDTLLAMRLFRTYGVEVESVHKVLLLENT